MACGLTSAAVAMEAQYGAPYHAPGAVAHVRELFVPRRQAMAHKMVWGRYHVWPGPIDGESEPVESGNVRSPMKFDC